MAREREKKDIPDQKKRRKRKYLRHLVHFFLFSRKKKQNSSKFGSIATFRYFLCCCCCFVFLFVAREKGTNFEETRETKRKLLSFPQDNIVVKSQSRDSFGSNKQHQQHQMMMMMMRNRTTTTTTKKKTIHFLLLAFLLCFCFSTTFAFGEQPQSQDNWNKWSTVAFQIIYTRRRTKNLVLLPELF